MNSFQDKMDAAASEDWKQKEMSRRVYQYPQGFYVGAEWARKTTLIDIFDWLRSEDARSLWMRGANNEQYADAFAKKFDFNQEAGKT